MGRILRAAAVVLGSGLAAGLVALVAGLVWLDRNPGGAEALGALAVVVVYLVPAAFGLGALAGAVVLWRRGRRPQ